LSAGCPGSLVSEGARLDESADLHVLYGVTAHTAKLFHQLRDNPGQDYLYLDNGYFGRGEYYRVTLNSLQHDGTGNAKPDRFHKFGIPILPWRKTGDKIILTAQSELWYSLLFHEERHKWIYSTQELIRVWSHREIVLRMKPDPIPNHWVEEGFLTALQGQWAVVTHSSNTAVEAILQGIPGFVTHPEAAPKTLGFHNLDNIENPPYPEGREQWAWNLAANQWTVEEMRNGTCWKGLCKNWEESMSLSA